jgi:glycosyltransferase involved in cell wall biosynthesis
VQQTTRNKGPLVSVVIPVYNTERYVADTVRSVLNQTYRHLDVIIVIDGSTDRSLEICRGFDDPRIRIIEQENRGLAGARNRGIREARGELIGFLDSDDEWLSEKVERHVQHFDTDMDLGVSFSWSALMDEAGELLGTYQKEGSSKTTFEDFYVRNVMGNGSNALLRTTVFTGRDEGLAPYPPMHGFDEDLRRAEDYELWSRVAALTGWRMGCLTESLVKYRINPGGLSANLRLQRHYHFMAMARVAAFAPDAAEYWRNSAVAHAYWHQARSAASQYLPRVGTNAVKLALRYDWRSLNPNHFMIGLAVAASLLLQQKPYFALQRTASRAWGHLQWLTMRWAVSGKDRRKTPQSVPPAASLVKKPNAYVRRKAMPNLFFLCHRHRFMYLGVSKNASTSMKHLIWHEENPEAGQDAPDAIHRYWGFTATEGRTIDIGDRAQLSEYADYLKFAVYRDPVSRFLSAYHNKVLFPPKPHVFYTMKRLEGMGLDQFIRVAESVLKIGNPLHIDEHLRPQAWCYQPADVDWIVPIGQLQAFLRENFGFSREQNRNKTVLPRLKVTEEQKERIRQLYACDYSIEPNWRQSAKEPG